MLDGKQYLLATGGSKLFSFVLDQAPVSEKPAAAAAAGN
jgi:hypothetical protein